MKTKLVKQTNGIYLLNGEMVKGGWVAPPNAVYDGYDGLSEKRESAIYFTFFPNDGRIADFFRKTKKGRKSIFTPAVFRFADDRRQDECGGGNARGILAAPPFAVFPAGIPLARKSTENHAIVGGRKK